LLAELITPKVVEPHAVPGAPKVGLLKALNASARNCRRKRSAIWKLLSAAKLKLLEPGAAEDGAGRMFAEG